MICALRRRRTGNGKGEIRGSLHYATASVGMTECLGGRVKDKQRQKQKRNTGVLSPLRMTTSGTLVGVDVLWAQAHADEAAGEAAEGGY